jgi:hypothetical protein
MKKIKDTPLRIFERAMRKIKNSTIFFRLFEIKKITAKYYTNILNAPKNP